MTHPPRLLRRRAVLAAALAAPALLSGRHAWAGGAITLIVPGPAGSATDQAARTFAPFLERHLARSTVWIANRPGEGGLNGFRRIAQAEPDGHSIGWVGTPALPARSIDHAGMAALMGDLRMIGAVAAEPIVFAQSGDRDDMTLARLIDRHDAAARALPVATPPDGSPAHLAALALQRALSLQRIGSTPLDIVPFPSAAAARQAAQSGNVAAAALGLTDAMDALRNGRLDGLALVADARFEALPDLPLFRESGIALDAPIHRGIAAPASLPDALAEKLAAALQEIVADPEFQAEGVGNGFLAKWVDGATWATQTAADGKALASLWHELPWLPSNSG